MMAATNSRVAPWYVVEADDKRRARLNCIAHLLSLIPTKMYCAKELDCRSDKSPAATESRREIISTCPTRIEPRPEPPRTHRRISSFNCMSCFCTCASFGSSAARRLA
jgi:hypothetical protein